jgi:hypothetical protein
MIFSIPNLIDSIAGQLATVYPDMPVYDSPTFDTNYPCFYVFLTFPSISDEIDGVEKRSIGIDVVYVQQRNITAANVPINEVLESFDLLFDTVNYSDGNETAVLHTFERNQSIEDQELHYKFTIKQRVSRETVITYMQEMEQNNVEVKEG